MAVKTIDPQTARNWLAEGSAVLVDVREPAEYRAAHIPKARLMPLSQVAAEKLPSQSRVVIHCQKGGRGNAACEALLKQQPALEVFNLEGGIEAWRHAGLPVEKGQSAMLPLDRQVQLTIGLLLLTAVLLTLMVNPAFIWLAAFLGAGLTVAGLTGFCGMALVMARMPWNR
jgi:rhodanese-related sulfurtransferase